MNQFIKIIRLLITACTIVAGHAQEIEKKVQLSFLTGYQQENFNWSIAGNTSGQNPNILSELKWRNVSGQDYAAALHWNFWRRISLFAGYNRASIKSGSVNDMDYNGDNRTQPISTGNFSDNKGYTSSVSGAVGYIICNNRLFSFIPYAGYGFATQSLYLVDLTGQSPGLNSSYRANWTGPFIKVRSSVRICDALNATADIIYSQVNYSAQGNWNLINEFQHPLSYRHAANGFGLTAGARLSYQLTKHIGVSVGYSYFTWQTGAGNDQLYLATGQVDKTQLNGVFRNGFEIIGGLNILF